MANGKHAPACRGPLSAVLARLPLPGLRSVRSVSAAMADVFAIYAIICILASYDGGQRFFNGFAAIGRVFIIGLFLAELGSSIAEPRCGHSCAG